VLNVLTMFVHELRVAGLPVSLTENIDALAALRHVRLDDRAAFRSALAATLVKSAGHMATFDVVFEVFFALPPTGDSVDGVEDLDLAALVADALAEGDEIELAALAAQAVGRFAGMEVGRPLGGSYYLYRTLQGLDLDGLVERLLSSAQDLSGLERRLAEDEYRVRADRFRDEAEAEIRRRLVADRGPSALARTLRQPLPEDVDFMHASHDERAGLGRALQPLARKLAVRLARRRRHRRAGTLDVRNTMRHALSYGGVPVEPRFRRHHPAKPELMVVADISGSVAAFARFTLQLVHALSGQFVRVRSFVFIDGIDEVTALFEESADIAEALRRVNTEADVVWADGHSDYGHALSVFWDRWGSEIGPRTTVLVLGDARNNYHDSAAWVMKEVAAQARALYWLNPEPRSYWDTGDSIVALYAAHCTAAYECRNLRQLEAVVARVA